MRSYRLKDRGPAVAEIRAVLAQLGLLETGGRHRADADTYDGSTDLAVRAFQQLRGLTADGIVGSETWRALDAARWQLGARVIYHDVSTPLVGDDVRALQEQLLEMGYDPGRADGIFGRDSAHALAQFQREVGLASDGSCGPATMHALRRLGRRVVGGRPQLLRESDRLRGSGPAMMGKLIVIDPGHGGDAPGTVVDDVSEATLVWDLASRLEGRLTAAGVRVHMTRGPGSADSSEPDRARLANSLDADLLISLHLDSHSNPAASGVATYHFGTSSGVTSTVGEQLAGLVQREIVARTGLVDCRTHAKTWEILRLTRMPAVRVTAGYLTSPDDRARLVDPTFRDQVVEAIIAAAQRMYLPRDADFATGTFDVSQLRRALAAAQTAAQT